MDVKEEACRAWLPLPALKGFFPLSLEPSLAGADWPCWGVLTLSLSLARWPCALGRRVPRRGCGKGRVGGVGGAVVESLGSFGGGEWAGGGPQCWGVSAEGRNRSQGGRAVGEPWVRAQPPAPAVKVEFTPSRAGPAPLFSVSVTAVKLFPSFFWPMLQLRFFEGWVFEGFYNLPC